MKHYIRDLNLSSYVEDNDRAQCAASFSIFHFLRNAGWTWLWECDGQLDTPGHCPDGNMEDSGVTNWTVSGGTRVKDTTTVHTGTQSLKWSSTSSGQTLQSANFTNTTTGRDYEQVIWVYNNSGQSYSLDVYNGSSLSGSPVSLPSNGAWTSYRISFTKAAPGSAYMVVNSPGGAGSYDIHIDSCMTFESFFEYGPGMIAEYSDGQIFASNEFNSASYSFTGADVGRHVVIWDPTNLGNSGIYEITSVATNATLDFRAGGAETLTTATGLSWRLIDINEAPKTEVTSANESACGWGLQSPDTSGMRLFMRHREDGGTLNKFIVLWSSPEDSDFNVLDGNFYANAVTSQRRTDTYQWSKSTSQNLYNWVASVNASTTSARLYLMTDDDGTFVAVALRLDTTALHGFLVGYTGAAADFSTIETWVMFAPYNSATQSTNNWLHENDTYRMFNRGLCVEGGQSVTAGALVYGCKSNSIEPVQMTNAKANPFDSEEWLQPLIFFRNKEYAGYRHGEKECDVGVYLGRQNMTDFTTFDSDNYFFFKSGTVWDWPGISVIA